MTKGEIPLDGQEQDESCRREKAQGLEAHPQDRYDELAEHILRKINPSRVLHLDCQNGDLVAALRKRGLDAFGLLDPSVHPIDLSGELRPFFSRRSLLEPLEERYDLVVWILKRAWPSETDLARVAKNVSLSTQELLLIVQGHPTEMAPPVGIFEEAISVLLEERFVLDAEGPYCVVGFLLYRFRRTSGPLRLHLMRYVYQLMRSRAETWARRAMLIDMATDLARKDELLLRMQAERVEREETLERMRHESEALIEKYRKADAEIQEYAAILADLQKAKEGLEAEIQSHASLVAELRETIETLEAENRAWSARWQDLEAGIGWQLLHRLRLLRLRYLPRGSRRERWMKATFAGLRKIQTEGFRRGLARGLSSMVAKAREKRRPGRGRAIPPALAQVIQIAPVAVRGSVPVHREPVDIVICVHNALEDVRACLNSLLENTEGPYTIVLVDDGSEEETASFLRFFAQANDARLIRNEKALGYTRAANIGMSAREGEFVVLLNSDTIVTPGWLDRLIACANSGPRIGVVGPLSNTASWQSIPEIEQGGDWAPNPIPPGYSVEDVGRLVARYSAQLYPWMPFLNGFCLLIRRELLDEIGGFDEEHFGQGYGEEDDFVLRARKAGWCLALADDAYVYHAQSRSYTTEGRRQRYEVSGRMLRQLHGEEIIREGVQYCLKDRVLEGIRARSRVMFGRQDWIRRGRRRFDSARVLFVLPIMTPGGGGNVIIQESRAMSEMGVEVAFFNLNRYEQGFQRAYPSLEIPCFFGEIEELPDIARGFDAVVATYNPSVAWLGSIERKQGKPCIGYYIQGFEPLMYPEGSADYQVALDSYTAVEGLKRFVKTRWTRNQILTNIGVDSEVVGVSVDIDLFRPRPRAEDEWPSRPLRVAAMVRPASPYRSPFLTLELLHLAHAHFGGDVEFVLFGSEPRDPEFLQLTEGLPCKVAGVLTREQMANLMNQVDVFVDFSQHQAMGLSALEAMACGVAVIVPANGGAVAYARHAVNSFVVDTSSKEACWMALRRIIEDHELRSTIQQRALRDVVAYYPEKVAYRILEVLLEKESNAQ